MLRNWVYTEIVNSPKEGQIMKQQSLKKLMAMLMVVGLVGGLAGCNTFAGAGKDVQRGGEAVTDAAHEVQNAH